MHDGDPTHEEVVEAGLELCGNVGGGARDDEDEAVEEDGGPRWVGAGQESRHDGLEAGGEPDGWVQVVAKGVGGQTHGQVDAVPEEDLGCGDEVGGRGVGEVSGGCE